MGFEAPLALFAVCVAGAPVAIHLIKRRDLPTHTLPTVALLREVQAESRQRMRLADLALLALRVLALALLLACLARPFSLTRASANADHPVALAIILDDSASMGARGAEGTLFDAALARLHGTLDELPTGSEVVVVLAGAPPALLVPRTTDLDFVRTRLATLPPSGARADLPGAILRARRELSGANSADLRMLLLSDTRTDDIPAGGLVEPRGVALEVVPLSPMLGPNVAVRDVLVTPDYAADDQLQVQVSVVRTPTESDPEPERAEDPLGLVARVFDARGEPLSETSTTMDGASAVVRFTIPRPVERSGSARVEVVVDEDILAADNVRWVALLGRATAHVGVINGSPHRSPHLDEVTLLRAALEAMAETDLSLDVSMLDAAAIDAGALDALDVVILGNLASVSAAQGARLEAFVRDGGGVFLTAGDQVQVATYGAALPNCLPGRLEPPSVAPDGPLQGEAPFADVAEPSIRRRLLISPLALGAMGLLRYPDGSPALAGRSLGSGRCAVLTTTVDLAWGDFALSASFVPVLQQTLSWLLGARRPTSAPRPAEAVDLALPSTPSDVVVTTPDGRELPVPRSGVFDATRVAGCYIVRVNGQASERLSFTVGVDPIESDLRSAGVDTTPTARADSRGELARRSSWVPYLLLLAALALAAEALLRRRPLQASPSRRA